MEKKSEFAERSLLVTYAGVKMNQRAEIVAISRTLAIHTERKTARESGKYAEIEPAHYTDADLARIDAIYEQETRKGTSPAAGGRDDRRPATAHGEGSFDGHRDDRVPRRRVRVRAVRTALLPGGLQEPAANPGVLYQERAGRPRCRPAPALGLIVGQGHRQPHGLRLRGAPANGGCTIRCRTGRATTAFVERLQDSIRKFNYMGDTQFLAGEVVGKRHEDGRYVVDLSLRGGSTSVTPSPARRRPPWHYPAASTARSACPNRRPTWRRRPSPCSSGTTRSSPSASPRARGERGRPGRRGPGLGRRNWDTSITVREWWRRLADAGYAYPSWPAGLGGGGLPRRDAMTIAVGAEQGHRAARRRDGGHPGRTDPARARHRGPARRARVAHRHGGGGLVPALQRARVRVGPGQRRGRAPFPTATSGSSPVRRCGTRRPTARTSACCWRGRKSMCPSTPASRTSPST